MASKRYERPPLVEVRCEVVLTGGEWTDETPLHLRAHLAEDFPRRVSTPGGETKARLIMAAQDDSQTVQFFPDRVVVTQLRPYPGFGSWSHKVQAMVDLHNELVGSVRAERVGVRYINRIAVPDRHADITRFLKVESSHGNGFRRQINLKPLHPGHKLVATAGSNHSSSEPPQVALLDINDFVDAGDGGNIENLGVILEEAHENVERAFERLVTEEARQTFGENPANP